MSARKAIVAGAAALTLAPASAAATPQDVASTHAYIRADYALARTSEAKVKPALASVSRYIHRIGQECPHAAAGSPQNEESQLMSNEAAGALWSVAYGTAIGPIRTFAHRVRPLRWSNPRITALARGYSKSLLQLATLGLPDLCTDVRAWTASGFRTIPATTIRFDRYMEPIEAHAVPARLLVPYEQPADRPLIAIVSRLETKLEHIETVVGFNEWDSLLETVGLNQ